MSEYEHFIQFVGEYIPNIFVLTPNKKIKLLVAYIQLTSYFYS